MGALESLMNKSEPHVRGWRTRRLLIAAAADRVRTLAVARALRVEMGCAPDPRLAS